MWFQGEIYNTFFSMSTTLSPRCIYIRSLIPSNSSKGCPVPNYGKIVVKAASEHMFLHNFPLICCKNHLETSCFLQKISLGHPVIPIFYCWFRSNRPAFLIGLSRPDFAPPPIQYLTNPPIWVTISTNICSHLAYEARRSARNQGWMHETASTFTYV